MCRSREPNIQVTVQLCPMTSLCSASRKSIKLILYQHAVQEALAPVILYPFFDSLRGADPFDPSYTPCVSRQLSQQDGKLSLCALTVTACKLSDVFSALCLSCMIRLGRPQEGFLVNSH